jgi:VWFA-related protein
MSAAINYVVKTLHHLPDFLATRVTRSFDDSPQVVGHSGYAPITPLHFVGTFHRDITYRDGKEVLDAAATTARKAKAAAGPVGLTTWGEFGPVLGILLSDSTKGRVMWSRWEQGSDGPVAVFHFEVPKGASHYNVDFCCAWRDLNALNADGPPLAYHGTPGYHGDLYIDQASGAIVRATLEAELNDNDVVKRAAISVQYGEVEIGGSSYICPTRSVAISADMDRPGKTIGGAVAMTRINETTFTAYHRFGSTSRIVASAADSAPSAPPAESAAPRAEQVAATTSESGVANPAEVATPAVKTPAAVNAPPESTPTAQPAQDSAGGAAHGVTAAATVPNTSQEPTAQPTTPTFETTAREVVVDVVVTKGNGDPVAGLGKQDFSVAENGKTQAIDFFEEHTANSASTSAPPAMPPLPTDAVTNVPPAPEGDSVNVLLLDALNTEQQDQIYVHRQILEFLSKMKPGTRVAIFLLGAKLGFVQGFTTDTAVLLEGLKRSGLQPEKNGGSHSDEADDASDMSKLQTMKASPYAIEALQKSQADARITDYGARASMTFEALNYLAHYLAGVPGRKNLLWFASSFPVMIFPTVEQRENIDKNPSLRGYLQRVKQTADLFTVSQISVYPISAQGMMTEHILEADTAGPGAAEGSGHAGSTADGPMSNGTMAPFVAGAGARSDAVYAMEQLAASTGGKAFYNTNDLNGAMQRAINDGAHYYTVGYSPADARMDGSFRRIDVRLTNGKYKLAYRRGYNADERPALDARSGTNPLTPLLGFGLPGATGVLYGAKATVRTALPDSAPKRAGENAALTEPLTRYGVDFVVRTEDVDLQPDSHGERSGKILIGLKAYDHDGKAVNWEGDEETLNVKESEFEALKNSGIPAHLEIDLPANIDGQLVTAVYDLNSGKAGTLEIPLRLEGKLH